MVTGEATIAQGVSLGMKRSGAVYKAVSAVLLLSVLGGCAVFTPATPEEIVTKRANERWAARIKGDYPAAYQYNTAGYRQTISIEKFPAKIGAANAWVQSGEVFKVKCATADKCDVQIKMIAVLPVPTRGRGGNGPATTEMYTDETWILEEGQWRIFEKI